MPKFPKDQAFDRCRLEVRAGPREHGPPHFHVVTQEKDVPFEIATFKSRGKLPRGIGNDALEWAQNNQAALQAEWDRLHAPREKK